MAQNKRNLSRSIPSPIKRAVRKRCGFGCVICGGAIFHYDHFDPEFEFASSHDTSGITLLCPNHHEQKQKGLLTNEQVAEHNADPYAVKQGSASHGFGSVFAPEILMGQKTFSAGSSVIRIGGKIVLGFKAPEEENTPPRLSFSFSDRNSVEVFSVVDNEIICENEAYDIESNGQTWTVRSGHGNIDLKIIFDLPTRITVEKLNFRRRHWGLIVDGPIFELTFDDNPTISMTGPVKIVGPCMYNLEEDTASISSQDFNLRAAIPPSPLGSVPSADGYGFSLNWPAFALYNSEQSIPVVHRLGEVETIGIFLRRRDANKAVNEFDRIISLSQEQCSMIVEFAAQKLAVKNVMFNPGVEPMPNYSSHDKFLSNLGFPQGARRNGHCFCGSNERYKNCHGSLGELV